MDYKTIDKLKGTYLIYPHKNYIVLAGKKLYIFDTAGREIACRSDIPNVHKLHFLPADTVFVSGGSKLNHLISLETGQDLWTVSGHKYFTCSGKFASDASNEILYAYYSYREKDFIVKVDIPAKEVKTYELDVGLQAIKDICCDEAGTPCLLLSNYLEVGGKQISENGVLYQHQDTMLPPSAYFWKYRWTFSSKRIAHRFLDGTDRILTNDLHVYSPKTGESYYLLENEPDFQPPKVPFPSGCTLDLDKRYIILSYRVGHIVVDLQNRKIAARYGTDGKNGCIVGDEFWCSGPNGIIRRPFPMLEDLLPEKHRFWGSSGL